MKQWLRTIWSWFLIAVTLLILVALAVGVYFASTYRWGPGA